MKNGGWQDFLTTPLWFGYFAILELTSFGQTSQVSPCIIVSQEQATKNQSGYQACATVHEAVFSLARFIYSNAGHDNVIAFGTVVIAFFTLALWWSTSKLWKAGERHSERELRAYVMIEKARLDFVDTCVGYHGKPDATLTIRNSGQTPARNVTHWARMGFAPFPLPANLPLPTRGAVELPLTQLAPNGTIEVVTGLGKNMEGAVYKTLMSRTHAIYVIGEVRYIDAFGIYRKTDFLLFSTGEFVTKGTFASYESGNQIT